jgi:uncharacterized membrane protein YgcG
LAGKQRASGGQRAEEERSAAVDAAKAVTALRRCQCEVSSHSMCALLVNGGSSRAARAVRRRRRIALRDTAAASLTLAHTNPQLPRSSHPLLLSLAARVTHTIPCAQRGGVGGGRHAIAAVPGLGRRHARLLGCVCGATVRRQWRVRCRSGGGGGEGRSGGGAWQGGRQGRDGGGGGRGVPVPGRLGGRRLL